MFQNEDLKGKSRPWITIFKLLLSYSLEEARLFPSSNDCSWLPANVNVLHLVLKGGDNCKKSLWFIIIKTKTGVSDS